MGNACDFNGFDKGQIEAVQMLRMSTIEAVELRMHKIKITFW